MLDLPIVKIQWIIKTQIVMVLTLDKQILVLIIEAKYTSYQKNMLINYNLFTSRKGG